MMRYLWLVCVLCAALTAWADPATMIDLLSGKVAPLQVKMGEMQEGWYRVTVDQKGAGNLMQILQMIGEESGQSWLTYYTRGQVATIGDMTYLLAYGRPLPERPADDDEEDMAPAAPLTADSVLPLSLLDLRTTGSLLNIQKVNLQEEIVTVEQARVMAMQRQSVNNLRQLSVAIMMSCQDNDEVFPRMTTPKELREELNVYLDDDAGALFNSPLTNQPYLPNTNLSKTALGDVHDPSEAVLLYEADPWPDGTRCVAFVDGHVEKLTEKRWLEAKKRSAIE